MRPTGRTWPGTQRYVPTPPVSLSVSRFNGSGQVTSGQVTRGVASPISQQHDRTSVIFTHSLYKKT